INYILYKYLNIFIITYLDNMLVYINKILKEHKIHVKKVDIKKSEFTITRIKFLGLIISIKGI
ncbi:hypothetical protein K469DRAFT_570305, partial [Zopfia rhizophila CBS 207.26]